MDDLSFRLGDHGRYLPGSSIMNGQENNTDTNLTEKLSSDQKLAIQKYMLSLVVIPGLLLTLVSGAVGFLISRGFHKETEFHQTKLELKVQQIENQADAAIQNAELRAELMEKRIDRTSSRLDRQLASYRDAELRLQALDREMQELVGRENVEEFVSGIKKLNAEEGAFDFVAKSEILDKHEKALAPRQEIVIELENGWNHYAAGLYGKVRYSQSYDGIVRLNGLAGGDAATSTILATLPKEIWPDKTHVFTVSGAVNKKHVLARVDVTDEGLVKLFLPSAVSWVSLDSVAFRLSPRQPTVGR